MTKSSKILFLFQWFLVFAISDLAGRGLDGLLPFYANSPGQEARIMFIIFLGKNFITQGIILGIVEWFVIRQIFETKLWPVVSTIGFTLGGVIAIIIYQLLGPLIGIEFAKWSMSLSMIAFGIVAGASQWLILRNRFRRSYLWIIANTVGWIVTYAIVIMTNTWFYQIYKQGYLISGYLLQFTTQNLPLVLLTGISMLWLLQNHSIEYDTNRQK